MDPADIARLLDDLGACDARDSDPPVDVLLDSKTLIEFRCDFGKDRDLADLREERDARRVCACPPLDAGS